MENKAQVEREVPDVRRFNKFRKMIKCHQGLNRSKVIIVPIEKEDAPLAHQFTKILNWLNNKKI